MKLTILGSGTCIPYKHQGSSGYLLETSKSKILLDCGAGIKWKLEKIGGRLSGDQPYFFSHLHSDHTADLVPFLFATKYSRNKKREIFLWGGKEFIKFFGVLKKAYKNWIEPDDLNIDELKGG